MDGTVLNSIAAAERVWAAWAERHGVDVETFLPTIHGARAIDTIRRLNLPGLMPRRKRRSSRRRKSMMSKGLCRFPGPRRFSTACLRSVGPW
jgi:sugar-phosphatase